MTYLRHALLAALWAVCSHSHAEAVEWLAFPVGLNHELTMTAKGVQPLRVPARFAASVAKPPEGIQVKVFDVSGRKGRTDEIAAQFTAAWKPSTNGQAMALVFDVKPGSIGLLPGAYAVAVDIAPDFAAADAKIQTVTFSLTVPTPVLSSSPIVLHQTRIWNEPGTSPSVELGLTEDSGKATMSQLRITASRDSEKDHDDSGDVVVPSTVAAIGPGAAASVAISARGAFALGKTNGKLKIESPELAAPTVVPFEVHARREPAWIGFIAVAGVFLGYFVRVVLAKRRELLDARIAASDVVEAIDRQLRASDDEIARKALQGLREALDLANGKGDPKALTELAKKSLDAAATVSSELIERLKPLLVQADAVHALVDRTWSAVPGAQSSLDDLRATVVELDRLLERRDAGAVQRLLAARLKEKLAAYVGARQTHMSQVAEYFHVMADKTPPLMSEAVDSLKALANELDTSYPRSQGDLQTTTVDEAAASLAKLETEVSRCQKFAKNISVQAAAFVSIAQRKLLLQPDDPKGVFAPLREVTTRLLGADALGKDVADPQAPTANYPTTLLQLTDQWKTVLTGVVPDARRSVVEADVRAKLEHGDWLAAVDIAEKEVPRAGGNLGIVQDLLNATKSFVLDGGGEKVLSLPAASADARGYDSATVLTGSLAQRDLFVAQGKAASLLQSAVLAVIFVFGLYALYEPTWVGSLKEMLALFLLAFGVDLTYDGVVGELKKGKAAGT